MLNEIRSHTLSCYHVVEVRREISAKLVQRRVQLLMTYEASKDEIQMMQRYMK